MSVIPKVSVIVPVYGVEKYIAKCLKSIQRQTFRDFECIVVDDGSPDRSIEIGKQAVVGDSRFIFLEKANGGLASARNFGLDYARAEYVSFVDSDDYVEPDFLEEPYNKIISNNADICMLGINYVNEQGGSELIQYNDLDAYYSKKDFLISRNTVTQYAWSKMYKKSIFDEIRFDENVITYEDVYVTFRILYRRNIVNIKKPLYNYLQRGGTLSRDIKKTYLQDRFKIVEIQKEFSIDNNLVDSDFDYVLFTYMKTFVSYCIVKFALYSNDYNKDINELFSVIESDSLSFKNIIFMIKEERRIGLSLLLFKISPHLFRYLIRIWYKNRIF